MNYVESGRQLHCNRSRQGVRWEREKETESDTQTRSHKGCITRRDKKKKEAQSTIKGKITAESIRTNHHEMEWSKSKKKEGEK